MTKSKDMTIGEIVNAIAEGADIRVTVDNDCVFAYRYDGRDEEGEKVSDFNDAIPEQLLIDALTLLGINAERA